VAAGDGRHRSRHLQHPGGPLTAEPAEDTAALRADCARCSGLCCAALPYARGREFPVDKAAGVACAHLLSDFRCGIHDGLLEGGWVGCVTFDCFGAGQQVTGVTYGGTTWRDRPDLAAEIFGVFEVMRGLHELRFLLTDAACPASSYAAEAVALHDEVARLAGSAPEVVLAADLGELRGRAGILFGLVAAEVGGPSHRGALLMAADLRSVDLEGADLLGADLRDTDVRGADLSRTLFLTQPQVNAARGDAATRLPARLDRPTPWG